MPVVVLIGDETFLEQISVQLCRLWEITWAHSKGIIIDAYKPVHDVCKAYVGTNPLRAKQHLIEVLEDIEPDYEAIYLNKILFDKNPFESPRSESELVIVHHVFKENTVKELVKEHNATVYCILSKPEHEAKYEEILSKHTVKAMIVDDEKALMKKTIAIFDSLF